MAVQDLISLLILLAFSAFFAGSEISFVVSNKLKLEVKARKSNAGAKNAMYFTQNPQNFFSTILIANNIVNITFASLLTVILTSFSGINEFDILLISTTLLLILGELIPKYFARDLADRVI